MRAARPLTTLLPRRLSDALCCTAASRLLLGVTLLAPLLLGARPATAHVGNVPSKAVFYQPPPPVQLPMGDGGSRWVLTPAEADRHYLLAWQDGDNDPTGRFTFFYADHDIPVAAPTDAVDARDLMGNPTGGMPIGPVVTTVGGREARDVWVGCSCAQQDASAQILDGSVMPNCFDGGARWCDNSLDWDTSAVPDGVYWIYAVNTDPPFHIYNVSEAPVRVSHGAHRPPMVLVVKPGGEGPSADQSFRGAVIALGEGALTLDVAWGVNEADSWQLPLHTISRGLSAVAGPDGTVPFDWDTSAIAPGAYYIGATITDGNGVRSFTSSRYGMSVNHRGDMARPATADAAETVDLARAASDEGTTPTTNPGGCGCVIGGTHTGGRGGAGGPFALLIALVAIGLPLGRGISRRGPRRGSRSACTR